MRAWEPLSRYHYQKPPRTTQARDLGFAGYVDIFSGVRGTTRESCEVADVGKWRLATKRASQSYFKLRPFSARSTSKWWMGESWRRRNKRYLPRLSYSQPPPSKNQHLAVTPAFLPHITCRSSEKFTKYAAKNELFKRRTFSWSTTQSPATCISPRKQVRTMDTIPSSQDAAKGQSLRPPLMPRGCFRSGRYCSAFECEIHSCSKGSF